MTNFHKAKNIFKEWGKRHRIFPGGNEALKQRALDALPHKEHRTVVKRPARLMWAGSGILGLVLVAVVVSRFVLGDLSPATDSGFVYDTYPSGYAGSGRGAAAEESDSLRAPTIDFEMGVAEAGLQNTAREMKPRSIVGKMQNRFIGSPIDDTREFLKTGYGAHIKTRTVSKIATRIQTMIRGYGGRIDNASVNPKSAYISFVIPKSSLEFFRTELKDVLPERFIEENVQMTNLLPQKQQIEKDTGAAEDRLESLQNSRQSLIASHDAKAASIQKQINTYAYRISVLNKEVTTSTIRQEEINRELAQLNSQVRYQKQLLANENAQFQKSLNALDADIRGVTRERDALYVQDENLVKDVETVQGSVSLEWVSILELLDLYVPIYWIMGGAVVLLIGYLLFGRRVSFDEDLLA